MNKTKKLILYSLGTTLLLASVFCLQLVLRTKKIQENNILPTTEKLMETEKKTEAEEEIIPFQTKSGEEVLREMGIDEIDEYTIAETFVKPTETQSKPTETQPKPTETEPKPMETQPKPTETEPKPTETQPKPTENQVKPEETQPVPTPETSKPVIRENKNVEANMGDADWE